MILVTGMGVLSALGNSPQALALGLSQGRSGLAPFGRWDSSWSRCRWAGAVEGLSLLPGQQRLEAMALQAGHQALEQAGWQAGAEDPLRLGVFVSSSKGGMEPFGWGGTPSLFDYWPHQPGSILRDSLGWQGGGASYALACATGGYSLGAAYEAIREGRLDAALAGSVEASLTPLAWRSFEGLGVLAPCGLEGPPPRGCFDSLSRGFCLGEGGSVLLLESEAHARRRGARPLAELAGWACTADACHITTPDMQGSQAGRCLALALSRAGISHDGLGHLNAHGTGTQSGDQAEAAAIRLALGSAALRVPVSGIKPAVGHLLGASGSLEAAATVLALDQGILPATLNVPEPRPHLGFDLVRSPRRQALATAASLNMGFGGHNVCLAFRRP
jgi:3-oxoacyl-[acyl-carrier-protein] synthase II